MKFALEATILVDVSVDRKTLQFRIDTGADVSLLNEESWELLGRPMLTTTKERLRDASGKIMTFVGTCSKLVQFRNTIAEIQFFVKEGTGTNLLGMNWIQKAGLAKACVDFLESLGGPAVLPVEARL